MADDQVLTATEASRAFSELMHRVCYGGESFVIKKGQRLMARIAPIGEVESSPIPLAVSTTEPIITNQIEVEETPSVDMTADDAEFYRAWMEQVRKVEA